MNRKGKRHWKITLAVVAIILLVLASAVAFNLPKPLNTADSAYDLSRLDDGVYTGECNNGIVKVRVEVKMEGHAIADVRILRHQNGLGGDAEAVVNDVVRLQSVEVDAVSGATMSSNTILKAIENALSEGMKQQ